MGLANGYTQNTAPVRADEMVGIDDPSGIWAVNNFPLDNIEDLFNTPQIDTQTGTT